MKRFYIKIKSGSRVTYKNESGKIVKASSVKKGKRKIIEATPDEAKNILVERNIGKLQGAKEKTYIVEVVKNNKKTYVKNTGEKITKKEALKKKVKKYEYIGSGANKGELIPTDLKIKAKKVKKTKIDEGKFIEFSLLNINVIKEFMFSLSRNFLTYVKIDDINYLLQSKTAQSNFLLFFNKVNKKFFELFKKFEDSLIFFEIKYIENKKAKKSIFDFRNLILKVKNKISPELEKAMEVFSSYVEKQFKQTFQ